MTDSRHQISDEMLMGYSAGVLPQAFDLVVASHVELNVSAWRRLGKMESIGGAILSETAPVAVGEGSFAETMRRVRAAADAPLPKAANHDRGILPRALRDALGSDLDAVEWKPVAMGVKQAIVYADNDATVRLLSIPGGQAMPRHSHRGSELTLVLSGAYSDEAGTYRRGDLDEADDETDHTPVAEPGEDCICLAATEGRLRFRRLLPRLAQNFLKI